MKKITLSELEASADHFNLEVACTPEIDQFCSTLTWALPASQTMMPSREPWLFRGESGYVALMKGHNPEVGVYLQPLEAAWCFASGLLGAQPKSLARDFFSVSQTHNDWDLIFLSGLKKEGALFTALVQSFYPHYGLYLGHMTRRRLARIGDGVDVYLGRRSRNFRKNLKKSLRIISAQGIRFEAVSVPDIDNIDKLYGRLLAVESWCWKGLSGSGLTTFPMRRFYALMMPHLIKSRGLRLMFAQHQGRDIGYILGACFEGTYRGLQFSFDDMYRKEGLGNVLQWMQIRALMEEKIERYDLGSDSPYKEKWSDETFDTHTLIVRP